MTEKTDSPRDIALTPSRRQFLGGAIATSATFATAGVAVASAGAVFVHGVASGDPLATAVILWTRVSGISRPTPVEWSVAIDEAMTKVVKRGTAFAQAARDYTVKVDVTGLRPGETYYYKFKAAGVVSAVGKTKTLPVTGVSNLKFAVFSCSDYEDGYFNVYKEAARRDDLDACIHLGDYVYEYGFPGLVIGPGTQQPRLGGLVPSAEIVMLDQYRTRHALYKTDPDLQELHRKNPWIMIYDDHETANDSNTQGAENHQPATEGPWKVRETVALQAYYEWNPLRDPSAIFDASGNPQHLYRFFDFGGLLRLVMLDTRLAGRDPQLGTAGAFATFAGLRRDTIDGTSAARARTMFGNLQRTFVQNALSSSTQTWQLIGNQILAFNQLTPDINNSAVVTGPLRAGLLAGFTALFGAAFLAQLLALAANPGGFPNPVFQDSWTGYQTARADFLQLMRQYATNPIVISGDSHNAWTANLRAPDSTGAVVPVAPEFGGTSVTSGGLEQVLVGFPPSVYAGLLVETSTVRSTGDKLIFTDQSQRGFLLIDVTPTRVTTDHVFVSTVFAAAYTVNTKRFTVDVGTRTAVAI